MGVFFTPCLEKHLWRWACEVWANPVLLSLSFDIPFLLIAQEQVVWNLLCRGLGLGTFQSVYSVTFSIFSCLSFLLRSRQTPALTSYNYFLVLQVLQCFLFLFSSINKKQKYRPDRSSAYESWTVLFLNSNFSIFQWGIHLYLLIAGCIYSHCKVTTVV